MEDISDLPEEQLCSYCYGGKLSLMQGSPYSAYDEYHAATLTFINESKFLHKPFFGGEANSELTEATLFHY
ncbi:hypothetical protein IMZ48_20255 [Candidatus Bathyarchaeota archaeon]|nr:hypothetical protein [Candidatus Bathyarchaeota archaeon]